MEPYTRRPFKKPRLVEPVEVLVWQEDAESLDGDDLLEDDLSEEQEEEELPDANVFEQMAKEQLELDRLLSQMQPSYRLESLRMLRSTLQLIQLHPLYLLPAIASEQTTYSLLSLTTLKTNPQDSTSTWVYTGTSMWEDVESLLRLSTTPMNQSKSFSGGTPSSLQILTSQLEWEISIQEKTRTPYQSSLLWQQEEEDAQ